MTKATLIDGKIGEADHRTATYAIYCITHEQYLLGNISLRRANNVVGGMLGAARYGWRVVGITPEALKLFHEVGFCARPKGVQRAHLFNRIDTIRELMECKVPIEQEALFKNWEFRDRTILCLSKKENRSISDYQHYEIKNPDGTYFANAYIGYSYSPDLEGVLLQSLWKKSF